MDRWKKLGSDPYKDNAGLHSTVYKFTAYLLREPEWVLQLMGNCSE